MGARALMIQGTGSNVGKSMLVAGLCRAARRREINVAPFKPQNMSNNAAVTEDGGEIGRAQALQALACGKPLSVHMNPVLLKPETDTGAQVVVQGQRLATAEAKDYGRLRETLIEKVMESFARLKSENDLVLVEGAGSPAEVNLRVRDIANMGFACRADVPVILAGDIDRGGVMAQIVGTQAVLSQEDNAMIAGFLVNKFRGDVRLFEDGYGMIEAATGWRGYGILPHFPEAWRLPAEDAVEIGAQVRTDGYHIVCLALSRIANFDDLDPLEQEDGVRLTMLGPGRAIPGDADLVIIPGTKSTRGDLAFLRAQGWDIDLLAHVRRGGRVLGICGGYQMLGRVVRDPAGIEGAAGESEGLGLLDIETVMTPEKRLCETGAVHVGTGQVFRGYEIHIGRTDGPDRARPFARINGVDEGAASPDGRIAGSYLHGMFRDNGFRAAWLRALGVEATGMRYDAAVEEVLDALADHMEAHLDVAGLLNMAR